MIKQVNRILDIIKTIFFRIMGFATFPVAASIIGYYPEFVFQ